VGKLRARLATSRIDQEFQIHLAAGEEALQRGLGVCRRVGGRQNSGLANETQRVLRQSLLLVDSLTRLEPPIEDADMDTLVIGEEALKRLIGACQRIGQTHSVRKVREAQRVLEKALTLVADLSGTLTDVSDLTPEETRNEMFRRRREEARRLAREEARKGR